MTRRRRRRSTIKVMTEPGTPELPKIYSLSRVDRKASNDLIFKPESPITQLIGDFFDRHSNLEETIFQDFNAPKETVDQLYQGAGIAGVLLENSAPRTGGRIPKTITDDAIEAALTSEKEEQGSAQESIVKLFDDDPELFLGITYIATKMKVNPLTLLEGAQLTRNVFSHVLESERLKDQIAVDD